MRIHWKMVLIGFAVCCLIKSEILTGLFLLALMVPAVLWIMEEAAKRS